MELQFIYDIFFLKLTFAGNVYRKPITENTKIIITLQGSSSNRFEQEGQVAVNCSPEFCLKLTYRYLLKADHVPGDT